MNSEEVKEEILGKSRTISNTDRLPPPNPVGLLNMETINVKAQTYPDFYKKRNIIFGLLFALNLGCVLGEDLNVILNIYVVNVPQVFVTDGEEDFIVGQFYLVMTGASCYLVGQFMDRIDSKQTKIILIVSALVVIIIKLLQAFKVVTLNNGPTYQTNFEMPPAEVFTFALEGILQIARYTILFVSRAILYNWYCRDKAPIGIAAFQAYIVIPIFLWAFQGHTATVDI